MDIYPGAEPQSIVFFDYQGTILRHNAIVRGMDIVIRDIAKVHRLIIVSMSPKKDISATLEKAKLLSCFKEIISCTGYDSKGDIMKNIASECNVPLERCIFVTDTQDDLLEAKHAGIEAIFVPWGIESNMPEDRETVAVRTPAELSNMLVHFCT